MDSRFSKSPRLVRVKQNDQNDTSLLSIWELISSVLEIPRVEKDFEYT